MSFGGNFIAQCDPNDLQEIIDFSFSTEFKALPDEPRPPRGFNELYTIYHKNSFCGISYKDYAKWRSALRKYINAITALTMSQGQLKYYQNKYTEGLETIKKLKSRLQNAYKKFMNKNIDWKPNKKDNVGTPLDKWLENHRYDKRYSYLYNYPQRIINVEQNSKNTKNFVLQIESSMAKQREIADQNLETIIHYETKYLPAWNEKEWNKQYGNTYKNSI